ncbi:MAG: DUF3108 domain-containing protein [Ignavibacteriaceae bacterium]
MLTIIRTYAIVLLLSITNVFSQELVINNNVFSNGETLIYKVKWTFIRLGTITIKTLADQSDSNLIKVSMLVESNPTLFFININEYNETIIDKKTCTSRFYYGDFKDGSERSIINSSYDEETSKSIFSLFDNVRKRKIKSDTIYNSPKYVDGPSLFFFTRVFSRSRITHNLPTMVDGKIENTKLIFTNDSKVFEVDAFQNPVTANKYYGIAEWEGGTSQGLSGEFTGWISDDDAAIPIYAELKVLLGKLKIELEHCSRNEHRYNAEKISNK